MQDFWYINSECSTAELPLLHIAHFHFDVSLIFVNRTDIRRSISIVGRDEVIREIIVFSDLDDSELRRL